MRALVLHTANILGFRLPLNWNLLLASIGVVNGEPEYWWGRVPGVVWGKKLGKNPTCRFETVLPSLHPLAFLASFRDSSLLLSSCLFFYFLQLFGDFSPRFSLFLCLYQKIPISFLSLPDAIFIAFL